MSQTDMTKADKKANKNELRDTIVVIIEALLHPIRLVLTGEPDGLELDLAVPAIERGASLGRLGVRAIPGVAERAHAFLQALG